MTAFARTRSAVLAGALCAGLTTALAACGGAKDPDAGTNGVGKLPAARIEAKARTAAGAATAVRVSGKVVSSGRTYRLDMRLKEDGGVGEVSSGGSTFALLRVGESLYLKADANFWADHEAGTERSHGETAAAAAAKLEGKYVKVPPGDPAYDHLSGFTKMDVMLDGLLMFQGKREIGRRGEVDGRRTIQVMAAKGHGGLVDVSLIGTPYPLRLKRAGGAGVLHMADWNKEFSLFTPKREQVVDYGKKILTSG